MQRGLEDVPCSICWDSLFYGRNDLDEVLSIATTTCGHVFHDRCIRNWFASQLQTRKDAAARAGRAIAEREPGLGCPTCRSPCSKDLLTPPDLQRIFVNIGGDGEMTIASSSRSRLPASSPFRSKKDQEVLGLARRARDLQDEVGKFTVKSEPGVVQETMVKVEKLVEDVASDRALQSAKTYIGGLTKAVNKFISTLESNPLVLTLHKQITDLRTEVRAHQLRYAEHIDKVLPAAVEQARKEERHLYQRRLAEEKQNTEVIRAQYEKEKVARRVARSTQAEREEAVAREKAALQAQLKRSEEEREALLSTVAERTKLLKFAHAKAEDRRNLKGKVEELEAEVARLRSEATRHASKSSPRASASPGPSRHSIDLWSPSAGTSSDPMHAPWDRRGPSEDMDPDEDLFDLDVTRNRFADESLQVDLPISEDISYGYTSKPSTTARTYAFDLDSPKRRKAGSSHMVSSDDSGIVMLEPSVVLAGSKRSHASPGSKSKTNPFSAGQSSTRRLLKASSTSTIHLGASTGAGKINSLRQPLQPKFPDAGGRKAKGKITGYLDMADANGRPKKGVVTGVKVRRLA